LKKTVDKVKKVRYIKIKEGERITQKRSKKMVNFLIVKKGSFKDGFLVVKTKIKTTAGFMRKTRELASKYATYSELGKKQLADVFIYDESNNETSPIEKFLTHRALIRQGHEAIAQAVKKIQGVELAVWIP